MGGFEGGDEAGFWEEKPLFTLKERQERTKKDNVERFISITDDGYEIKVKDDKSTKYHKISFEPALCDRFFVEIKDDSHALDAFENFVELLKEEGDTSKIDQFFLEHKVVITFDSTLSVNPAAFYAAFLFLTNVAVELSFSIDELKSLAATFDLQTGFLIEHYLD